MNYEKVLRKHIVKIVGILKDEDGLKEVLKRKLTKKEFKVLFAMEEEVSKEEIAQSLNCDIQRVEEIYASTIKKINQELFKRELIEQ